MKKISAVILKTEELLAGAMLCMIAVLVFWSAVARTHRNAGELGSGCFAAGIWMADLYRL